MSNVYVHFSQISFPARYSVVNFRLESHSLRFREVIVCTNIFVSVSAYFCMQNNSLQKRSLGIITFIFRKIKGFGKFSRKLSRVDISLTRYAPHRTQRTTIPHQALCKTNYSTTSFLSSDTGSCSSFGCCP